MLTKLDRLRTLRRFIGVQHRSYSAQISTHELDDDTKPAHRTKQRLQDETDVLKMAKDMRQHFSNVEKRSVLTAYPEHLVKKKSKLPTGLYNTCPHIARAIVDEVKKDLPADRPILEANPGIGKITDLLLRETKNDLILYEPDSFFHDGLNRFEEDYKDRNITVHKKDLLSLSRYATADFLDDGTRVSELFRGIVKKEFHEEPAGRVVMHTCSFALLRQLLRSVMFQNTLMASGRFEFYACIPPMLWMQLTCSGGAGYMIYRASSVIFQLFFDYQIICTFDKRDFLPWLSHKNGNKLEKFRKINSESLYFVKFVPRQNLLTSCRPDNLPALWYFVAQNMTKRAHRVIPQLEQWIPGCGPRLIINSRTGVQSKLLYPEPTSVKASVYHESCRELVNNETIDNLSIYTEFGELSPLQIYSIFEQFINFPEFRECPFVSLMEAAMLKIQTTTDDTDLMLDDGDESKQDVPKID